MTPTTYVNAVYLGDGGAIGIGRIRIAVQARVKRIGAEPRKVVLRYVVRPGIPIIRASEVERFLIEPAVQLTVRRQLERADVSIHGAP